MGTILRLPVADAGPRYLPSVDRSARMPAGFVAGGTAAGIKASRRSDLALIAAERPAAAAATFTRNRFAAAPVRLNQAHLAASAPEGRGRYGWARAIVSTSGCANAGTGAAGDKDQAALAAHVSSLVAAELRHVLALSTGVIGTRLPVDVVRAGLDRLAPLLSSEDAALLAAAEALRTTDSRTKVASVTLALPDADGLSARSVTVSGIAKGVGMIHPNMATMLAVVLTDAAVEPQDLAALLGPVVARTWNQLSVDGDTSTNDTVLLLASGRSGSAPVTPGSAEGAALAGALEAVARDLARQQAADGEGATTLISCSVRGAADDADARALARSVVSSSLVKAAVHGRDPNWGRIVAAAGNARLPDVDALSLDGSPVDSARAGASPALDPDLLRVAIAGHLVFDGGSGGPVSFDAAAASSDMNVPELVISLHLGLGRGAGEAWGCDLTEEYVRENSEYTT
jgi:glutamate N-acetyltransferase/amino-acid N-acetyltransferase